MCQSVLVKSERPSRLDVRFFVCLGGGGGIGHPVYCIQAYLYTDKFLQQAWWTRRWAELVNIVSVRVDGNQQAGNTSRLRKQTVADDTIPRHSSKHSFLKYPAVIQTNTS